MTREFKFDIGDEVKTAELENVKGIVLAIFISGRWNEYEVRYFHGGEAKKTYFFEFELEHVK